VIRLRVTSAVAGKLWRDESARQARDPPSSDFGVTGAWNCGEKVYRLFTDLTGFLEHEIKFFGFG